MAQDIPQDLAGKPARVADDGCGFVEALLGILFIGALLVVGGFSL